MKLQADNKDSANTKKISDFNFMVISKGYLEKVMCRCFDDVKATFIKFRAT